jgi:hypothetical protein
VPTTRAARALAVFYARRPGLDGYEGGARSIRSWGAPLAAD